MVVLFLGMKYLKPDWQKNLRVYNDHSIDYRMHIPNVALLERSQPNFSIKALNMLKMIKEDVLHSHSHFEKMPLN